MGVPARLDDITGPWLGEVLGAEVESCEHESLGEGVGIMGRVARLRLVGDGCPDTLIAKGVSDSAENVEYAQLMGFYAREVHFYRSVAPTLDLTVPRCYHADMDDGGVPFVLLLEDHGDTRLIDQVEGASYADCERVIDTAAALHARYWDSPELDALPWLPPMNNPAYKASAQLARANWPVFVERYGDRLPARTVEAIDRLIDVYGDFLEWFQALGPVTYAHTDYRADNFLFPRDGSPMVLLDWQLSTRCLGTFDLGCFLGASVAVEDRRAWERDLLARYWERLAERGVEGYAFDDCWRDYRASVLIWAYAMPTTVNLDPGNERGRALLDAMTIRYVTAADDLEADRFVDY